MRANEKIYFFSFYISLVNYLVMKYIFINFAND
jgi:hypothetical protein